ncbi:hypothetical protein ACFLYU_02445 [Candidatus Dependentiae bacterium]
MKKIVHKKTVFVVMLFFSVSSFAWFGSRDKELDEISRSDMPEIHIPGAKKGKVRFTKIGKEVFKEFLKVTGHNMAHVRQMLNRHSGSKFYHLYSAYCYGFYRWKQSSNPYEKEKIKRAVWNIAMEFSKQGAPRWQTYFMQLAPSLVWTGIAIVTLLWGSYLRKNHKRFFEKYSDKIFDWAKKLVFKKIKI